jgi:hypothetical protein
MFRPQRREGVAVRRFVLRQGYLRVAAGLKTNESRDEGDRDWGVRQRVEDNEDVDSSNLQIDDERRTEDVQESEGGCCRREDARSLRSQTRPREQSLGRNSQQLLVVSENKRDGF